LPSMSRRRIATLSANCKAPEENLPVVTNTPPWFERPVAPRRTPGCRGVEQCCPCRTEVWFR
jgi:hypothetical protein